MCAWVVGGGGGGIVFVFFSFFFLYILINACTKRVNLPEDS